MNQKKSRTWIMLSLIIVILCVVVALLWNTSLFGKQLPEFIQEPLSTLTTRSTGEAANTPGQASTEGSIPLETVGGTLPPEVTEQPDWATTPEAIEEIEGTPLADELELVPAPTSQRPSPATSKSDNQPVCGRTEPMIFLAAGIDLNEQADVIRLVRFDFATKRILVLSIPRDLWVAIPGMQAYDITQHKINAAYGFGEYFNGKGQGIVSLSNTIYQNFHIPFDRYVVFHFSNFEEAVDAVGGVDIVLEEPIGAYGEAGTTHLNGEEALWFARYRLSDSDVFRIRRQTEIIKSLFKKMTMPENILKLPGLGMKFLRDKTVLTDLSLHDVYTFTCLAGKLTRDSLVFVDLPPELYRPARTNLGNYVTLPTNGLAPYIHELVLDGNY